MRYFIQKSFINEVVARKNYLYDVLSLWTIPYEYNSNFIVLNGIPLNYLDVCFIFGHNHTVKDFIEVNNINEEYIVAITCDGHAGFNDINLQDKKLYLAKQGNNNLVDLLKGELYGFDFDLTESEILFFNSSKSLPLSERLNACFSQY